MDGPVVRMARNLWCLCTLLPGLLLVPGSSTIAMGETDHRPLSASPPKMPLLLEPWSFWLDHCWKGAFPDGKTTDEHCFSRVFEDKFIRDVHVVHADGHPDYVGETIYYVNWRSHRVEYLYFESDGGLTRATMTTDGAALIFPRATLLQSNSASTYRSRWVRDGDDAYIVTTEFETKGIWGQGLSLRMVRSK